ncbi:MAG: hypothetical protein AAF907_08125, partial [Planctomycetota bacterium]
RLAALIDAGATGRRALRTLREVRDEEAAVADGLAAWTAGADAGAAAPVRASLDEIRAVAAGLANREPPHSLLPLAERAAARLEALVPPDDGDEHAADPTANSSEETAASADAAALIRWQEFLLAQTLAAAPEFASLSEEQRALAETLPPSSPAAAEADAAAERLAAEEPTGGADRQRAVLSLLNAAGAPRSVPPTAPETSNGSPDEGDPGTLGDGSVNDAEATGTAGGLAGAGGSSGGDGPVPGGLSDGPAFPWGRLPARLRERLADAADAHVVPGFADLTARYRERLGAAAPPESFAPPPSSVPPAEAGSLNSSPP